MLKDRGFHSSLETLKLEHEVRTSLTQASLSFGVRYLDDATGGIISSDLVLIGAATGTGKSELVANIAYNNAKAKKKIYAVFLEAYKGEIELRQKYREIAKQAVLKGLKPSFRDWITGKQPWLDELAEFVDFSHFANVYTKYRDQSYTIEDLNKDLLSINEDADLIVIDHLHYFDIDDQNENRGMTRIVKTISDIIQVINRPVILVAHLRKRSSDFKEPSPLPSIDDFHGTSNITKIATKVILLGKGGHSEKAIDESFTFMHVAKMRLDSSVTSLVAATKYLHSINDYSNHYKLGRIHYDVSQKSWKFQESNLSPRWATKTNP
jgi:replicative DNA helicase